MFITPASAILSHSQNKNPVEIKILKFKKILNNNFDKCKIFLIIEMMNKKPKVNLEIVESYSHLTHSNS